MRILFASIVLLWASQFTAAEQMQRFGDYEVHYSVVPTRFIPAEVARVYKLSRGSNRMMLNISVRKRTPEDPAHETKAQAAFVTGQRNDLIRPIDLDFREVREQDAVYYLADFLVINEELSHFDVQVTLPDGQSFDVKFVKKMYID